MPIKLDWTLDEFEAEKFAKSLLRRSRTVLTETAKMVPIDLTERIPQRVAFDGGAQQENTEVTSKRKKKKYGHDIPLRAQGVLGDPSQWTIDKPDPDTRRIKPPASRADIILYLQARNYRVLGISQEVRDFMAKRLQSILDNLRRDMRRYVKRRAKGNTSA